VAERLRDVPDDISQIDTFAMLADVAVSVADREAACLLAQKLEPASARHAVVAQGFCHRGSVAYYLGSLSEAQDDLARAEHWYSVGLARDRALGALPFVARGQVGLGRVLGRRGGDLLSRIQ
jgi:hypothetical protein